MSNPITQPRILIVSPEVVFVPDNAGKRDNCKKPLQSGFAGFLSSMISHLFEMGADIHVAQPDYRKIFSALLQDKQNTVDSRMPGSRVHLAEDRTFFYANPLDSNSDWENKTIAIAFQREAIHQSIPHVQPDLIHCHDWMTGLIPAMAKQWRIPCLFTVQNLRTAKSTLSKIEDKGIDGATFWQHLFYSRYPGNYEETRITNSLDFLLSGILAARYVNTAGPVKLTDIVEGQNELFDKRLRQVLVQKWRAGLACQVHSPSESSCNPAIDKKLHSNYGPNNQLAGKQKFNRIMERRMSTFNHQETAQSYIDLYEHMLQRRLINRKNITTPEAK